MADILQSPAYSSLLSDLDAADKIRRERQARFERALERLRAELAAYVGPVTVVGAVPKVATSVTVANGVGTAVLEFRAQTDYSTPQARPQAPRGPGLVPLVPPPTSAPRVYRSSSGGFTARVTVTLRDSGGCVLDACCAAGNCADGQGYKFALDGDMAGTREAIFAALRVLLAANSVAVAEGAMPVLAI